MTHAADTCDGLGESLPAPIVADLPEGVPALRTFYLYLSTGCNLHCRHCWITPTFVNGKPSPGECIDFELLKAAVAEAKPMGLSSVKLTGGEPVLHPEFLKISDFLTAENLRITMETNATLVDQDMARHLRETNFSFIAASLDSPDPGQHDRIRGVKGAFDAAVRGLSALVAAGFKPQIIMSVDRENVHQIEALIELAMSLGAGSVKFNPVVASGRGAEVHRKGQGLSFDELLEMTHRVRGPLQDRYSIYLSAMVPPALLTVRELLRHGGSDGGCCHVRNILGILGTGEMALCGIGRNIPELCFGMLGKDSLRRVWIEHPTLRRMRQDLAGQLPGVCGDCLHAGRCQTHCLAMNYEATGRLVNVSPLCAEAERRGQFPSTRRISCGREHPAA
ncbi:MAG: radical SAM protein [Deltaproteobacteria bacterium]|nr:radical SAM protein [Deltaproteobacteria bacterium]